MPQRIDPSATLPTEEPGPPAEAVRRALPELTKLDRYEARAVARRDRAIRQIVKKNQVATEVTPFRRAPQSD